MKRKVICPGCGRKMVQLIPKNRDYSGRSWHYNCFINSRPTTAERQALWEASKGSP